MTVVWSLYSPTLCLHPVGRLYQCGKITLKLILSLIQSCVKMPRRDGSPRTSINHIVVTGYEKRKQPSKHYVRTTRAQFYYSL